MATAPWKRKHSSERTRPTEGADALAPRKTGHLKDLPENRQLGELLRGGAFELASKLDKSYPLTKSGMETLCRELLVRLSLPEAYLGWTMVMLLSAFWHDQVAAVPVSQRLLLLPAGFAHAESCGAEAAQGTVSQAAACLACEVDGIRRLAIELGYQVLVANRSADLMRKIIGGEVNAVIGLAPLDLLERVTDKVMLAGIPCQAIPLPALCDVPIDRDWIVETLRTGEVPALTRTKTYLHLLRAAARIFQPAELERLAPRLRETQRDKLPRAPGLLDPVSATEVIAYDFLGKGGKHSRPFITLAVYDALMNRLNAQTDGIANFPQLPDAILRAALSIETFHKASLVHDDIEDDDEFRYGDPTLHRVYGTATAINVGDYLIGLGYRLVSRETGALGADVTADILDALADAHMRLSEGQGAELMWRDSRSKLLAPRDAIHIYALKTAPAFQAALYAGVRLAGPIGHYRQPVAQFARQLGIAFQILNDLNDWDGDPDNKKLSGGDVVGGRPTVLWALALDGLGAPDRERLLRLAAEQPMTPDTFGQIRQLYIQAGVFERAAQLIEKHQRRAEAVASAIEPEELRRLLFYLIDMVLDRQMAPVGTPEPKLAARRCDLDARNLIGGDSKGRDLNGHSLG